MMTDKLERTLKEATSTRYLLGLTEYNNEKIHSESSGVPAKIRTGQIQKAGKNATQQSRKFCTAIKPPRPPLQLVIRQHPLQTKNKK
jgi:hypothetical protein